MGRPQPMVKFLSHSPGYQAYFAHDERPDSAPIAQKDEHGRFIIYTGELFCRLPDQDPDVNPHARICYRKSKSSTSSTLTGHFKTRHPWATIVRPSLGMVPLSERWVIENWYDTHFAPGKGSGQNAGIKPFFGTPKDGNKMKENKNNYNSNYNGTKPPVVVVVDDTATREEGGIGNAEKVREVRKKQKEIKQEASMYWNENDVIEVADSSASEEEDDDDDDDDEDDFVMRYIRATYPLA
ncbi:hypothetical protein GGR50DRAFT_698369 [Xylaria sp. CBS 124048]|nr:hypothetical protein GGR50DRAFT_698369 [Xylaria sp. CBS 124048]